MKPTPRPLEPRLLDFGLAVGAWAERLPRGPRAAYVAKQVIRSSMSPAGNYGEARAAESTQDFAHKLQICLKELRETSVWLAAGGRLRPCAEADRLQKECNELVAIFVVSVNTVKRKLK